MSYFEHDLNSFKGSPRVVLDLVKIWNLATSSKKNYGSSNMAVWIEKSEILENYHSYFFFDYLKNKKWCTVDILSQLSSLMTIWIPSGVKKINIFKIFFWLLGDQSNFDSSGLLFATSWVRTKEVPEFRSVHLGRLFGTITLTYGSSV